MSSVFTKPILLALLLIGSPLYPQYPQIQQLNHKDILFKQLQTDIQAFYQARAADPKTHPGIPPLRFFVYSNPNHLDLFSLAARLNLPYDTMASLNNLSGPDDLDRSRTLVISNTPGIFVTTKPESSLQEIILSVSISRRQGGQEYLIRTEEKPRTMLFFPGERFLPVERAYFLNILFRFPLPRGRLSSQYGSRSNPFTGHPEFHQGIDIAASAGTEIFAARDGIVLEAGMSPILGNFVRLQHGDGYQTVYGHMSLIFVSLKQKVTSGMIIGRVGSSGLSTGPHLHFEVRRKGKSKDPILLLPGGVEHLRE